MIEKLSKNFINKWADNLCTSANEHYMGGNSRLEYIASCDKFILDFLEAIEREIGMKAEK